MLAQTVLFQTYSLSWLLPPAHLPLFVLFFSQFVSLCYTSTADVSPPSLSPRV